MGIIRQYLSLLLLSFIILTLPFALLIPIVGATRTLSSNQTTIPTQPSYTTQAVLQTLPPGHPLSPEHRWPLPPHAGDEHVLLKRSAKARRLPAAPTIGLDKREPRRLPAAPSRILDAREARRLPVGPTTILDRRSLNDTTPTPISRVRLPQADVRDTPSDGPRWRKKKSGTPSSLRHYPTATVSTTTTTTTTTTTLPAGTGVMSMCTGTGSCPCAVGPSGACTSVAAVTTAPVVFTTLAASTTTATANITFALPTTTAVSANGTAPAVSMNGTAFLAQAAPRLNVTTRWVVRNGSSSGIRFNNGTVLDLWTRVAAFPVGNAARVLPAGSVATGTVPSLPAMGGLNGTGVSSALSVNVSLPAPVPGNGTGSFSSAAAAPANVTLSAPTLANGTVDATRSGRHLVPHSPLLNHTVPSARTSLNHSAAVSANGTHLLLTTSLNSTIALPLNTTLVRHNLTLAGASANIPSNFAVRSNATASPPALIFRSAAEGGNDGKAGKFRDGTPSGIGGEDLLDPQERRLRELEEENRRLKERLQAEEEKRKKEWAERWDKTLEEEYRRAAERYEAEQRRKTAEAIKGYHGLRFRLEYLYGVVKRATGSIFGKRGA